MMTYPSTPLIQFDSDREVQLPAIRTESEAGYHSTRKRFTKNTPYFSLQYKNITLAEYQILEDFFLSAQGTIFDFIHPAKPTITHKVMFAIDKVRAKDVAPGICSTSIELIGV